MTGRVRVIVQKPQPGVHVSVRAARAVAGVGLEGDHDRKDFWRGERVPGREITAFAGEVGRLLGIDPIEVGDNLITEGVLLSGLSPGQRVRVGRDVVLERSGPSHRPCALFAHRFGQPAFEFVRSWAARGALFVVVAGGRLAVGDEITLI